MDKALRMQVAFTSVWRAQASCAAANRDSVTCGGEAVRAMGQKPTECGRMDQKEKIKK